MTIEALLAAGLGVLTATGVWLLLRARVFDVIVGLTLLSYAVNVFIFLTGRVRIGSPPIVDDKLAPTLASYADPLPQALVLTAIVIGFAMTAVLVALALRAYGTDGTEHVDGAPGEARDAAEGPEPRA